MTKGNRIWSILSGVISLFLGTLVITNPIPSLLTFVMILGAFMITAGIFVIIDAIRLPKELGHRSSFIFEGMMLVIIGLFFAVGNTFTSIASLSFLLLFWFIFTSIIQLQYAWTIKHNWVGMLSILLNVVVIGLSIYSLFNPILAASILAWTIALEFMISGVNKILLALFG